MATSLSSQLANIARNSTHQLDLKAQRQRHAVSILFEPREAVRQSFDDIFAIVQPSFTDLCYLDRRFEHFATSLFGADSLRQERENLTRDEHGEVNKIVRAFLQLLQGRLLLKPAQRCLEWLVRRWKIHEEGNEREDLLLACLPFHDTSLFVTILSVFRANSLPTGWKWLAPYASALEVVPRQAVITAATRDTGFFAALQGWTMESCKRGYAGQALVGIWTVITSQSVLGMLDRAQSGREEVQRQNVESILTRVLPQLQKAFTIARQKASNDLYLGACVLTTILAAKAELDDRVLDALMEAVVQSWTHDTQHEGMMALALIAQEKSTPQLPDQVFESSAFLGNLVPKLKRLQPNQRVDKLALAAALSAFQRPEHLSIIEEVVQSNILSEMGKTVLVKHITDRQSSDRNSSNSSKTALQILRQSPTISELIQRSTDPAPNVLSGDSTNDLPWPLNTAQHTALEADQGTDRMDMDESISIPQIDVQTLFTNVPRPHGDISSFLVSEQTASFNEYARIFETCVNNGRAIEEFAVTLASTSKDRKHILLSFLSRVWPCQSMTAHVRQAALQLALEQGLIKLSDACADYQVLLPYCITGLADTDRRVRSSAARLTSAIATLFGKTDRKGRLLSSLTPWAADCFYDASSEQISWLSSQDACTFTRTALLPVLEDCVLDSQFIVRHLRDALNGVITPGQEEKSLKSKLRESLSTFFAGHAVATASLSMKRTILVILKGVGKSASHARVSCILPYIRLLVQSPHPDLVFQVEGLSAQALYMALLQAVSHRSKEELELLKGLASMEPRVRLHVPGQAFGHLKHLYSHMKQPSQISLVEFLLDQHYNGLDEVKGLALDTLRGIALSTDILVHLLDALPRAGDLFSSEPPIKRRRTSSPSQTRKEGHRIDVAKLTQGLQKITTVLELVESNSPKDKPLVVPSLFKMLVEVEHIKKISGNELVWMQQTLLNVLCDAAGSLKSETEVDRMAIRADIVVELVRTTNNPQLHTAALRLMSALAVWSPETILHSIMPLFTFMSTSLLQRSDDYSVTVADRAIECIIPALTASAKWAGHARNFVDVVKDSSELLLSFVAAWEHVPHHRRLPLISKLVRALGPEFVLGATVASLMERYQSQQQSRVFAVTLLNEFSGKFQVDALHQYILLVEDGIKAKRGISNVLFGFNDTSDSEREESIAMLFEGLSDVINMNTNLRRQLSKHIHQSDQNAVAFKLQFATAMELSMRLAYEQAYNGPAAESVVISLTGLLPTQQLLEMAEALMEKNGPRSRQQLLMALERRIAQSKESQRNADGILFMEQGLSLCVEQLSSDNDVQTRHAAISTIDTIVEKFGRINPSSGLRAARAVAGPNALASGESNLQVISVLALATMVEVLEADFVPIFPVTLSTVLGSLESTALVAGSTQQSLKDAGFAFLNAVVDHLAYMLSGRDLRQALRVAATLADRGDFPVASQFGELCAQKVAFSEVCVAIYAILQDDAAILPAFDGLKIYLEVVGEAVNKHSKTTIIAGAQSAFRILLAAFDLCRVKAEQNVNDLGELTDLVNEVAMTVVLKVNDATFRPFYTRFVEFATTGLPASDKRGKLLRKQALYSFSLVLFGQLKSIVTSYASLLLEDVAEVLTNAPSSVEKPDELKLLRLVLRTLEVSFSEDRDDFWMSPSHFDAVAAPLLSLLSRTKMLPDDIVQKHLIPSVAELAGTVSSSPDHLKDINGRLLTCLQDDEASARLSAVLSERTITEKLEEDWLVLLPEMLPAISELLEDDDEAVERATVAWVRDIERITGESLDGMLA